MDYRYDESALALPEIAAAEATEIEKLPPGRLAAAPLGPCDLGGEP